MGELNMVLNGIEFRTRHNDYRLRMPSRHSNTYNAMENIQFPPVPPAVLNKTTVHEQNLEMREWFRGTPIISEPPHDKTNKITRAPSEDSDQPGHSPSLNRAFAVHSVEDQGLIVSS